MVSLGKPGWTEFLRRHGKASLEWIAANGSLTSKFNILAEALSSLLQNAISTPEVACEVWRAAPAVLSRCNEQSTYEMPAAPYAYAWLHLLDRYARTWHALEKLLAAGYLPLARDGVRALDVGTGPGPSAFAIHDFYDSIVTFGAEKGIKQFNQPPTLTCVEFDRGTNSLRHALAEIAYQRSEQQSKGLLAMCSAISDFREIEPTKQRKRLQRQLLREEDEYYDEVRGEWTNDLRYSAEEANDIAQSLHRYRLIVFSNFLTKVGVVRTFEANLVDIMSDAQPGSTLLLIGGKEGPYPGIYEYVDRLAKPAGFQLVLSGEEVSSAETKVADRIFVEGAQVYSRLQCLAPNCADETASIRSHFTDSRQPAPVSQIWAYRKYGRAPNPDPTAGR